MKSSRYGHRRLIYLAWQDRKILWLRPRLFRLVYVLLLPDEQKRRSESGETEIGVVVAGRPSRSVG